jgi:hypothetical protein
VVIPEYSPPLDDTARRSLRELAAGKRVTIYEDALAWSGNPAPTVLAAAPYNMVFNTDYFKRPTSDLATLNIADTEVAWLSSDGARRCTPNTNTRANVGKLRDFVAAGGVLIADLATNCRTVAVAPTADGVFDPGALNYFDPGPSALPTLPDNSLATTPNNLTGLTGGSLAHGFLNVRHHTDEARSAAACAERTWRHAHDCVRACAAPVCVCVRNCHPLPILLPVMAAAVTSCKHTLLNRRLCCQQELLFTCVALAAGLSWPHTSLALALWWSTL